MSKQKYYSTIKIMTWALLCGNNIKKFQINFSSPFTVRLSPLYSLTNEIVKINLKPVHIKVYFDLVWGFDKDI